VKTCNKRCNSALLGPFDDAQGRPFDIAQGRPFDVTQGRPTTSLAANPLFTCQRAVTPINPRHVSHPSHQRSAIIVVTVQSKKWEYRAGIVVCPTKRMVLIPRLRVSGFDAIAFPTGNDGF
jgi:hypothetical protein